MTDSEGGASGYPRQPADPPAPPAPYTPPSSPPPTSSPPADQADSAWGYQPPAPPSPYGSQGTQAPPGQPGAPGAQPGPPPYGAQQAPPAYGAQQAPPPYGSFGAPGASPSARRLPNQRILLIGGAAVVVVVVLVVVIVLVTGGGGSSPTATTNQFIQAVLSNNGAKVCSLVIPSDLAACQQKEGDFTGASGSGQVVNQVIDGTEALVSVTGKVCFGGSSNCESNSDASSGMPGNGVTFDQAFSNATSPDFDGLSPTALEEINGTWYVVP